MPDANQTPELKALVKLDTCQHQQKKYIVEGRRETAQQCWAGLYDRLFLLKAPGSVVMLVTTALRVSSPEVTSGAHLPLYHFLLFSAAFLQI